MHGADQRQGRVELGTLDSGLAPGQWAAFYSGEECLGGGIIAERRDLYVCVGGDADVVGGRGGEGFVLGGGRGDGGRVVSEDGFSGDRVAVEEACFVEDL